MSKTRTPRSLPAAIENNDRSTSPSGFQAVSIPSTKSSTSTPFSPRHITDIEAKNMFLSEEVARLNLRIRELEKSVEIDPIVDVFTRRAFMRELERARAMNARYDIPSAILVFHLSGLSALIDQYGPSLGDALLIKVREVFRTNVRHCDTVARLSHDEFGVLLFKTEYDIARTKAISLSEAIFNASVTHGSAHISVGVSWGVAPCDSDQTPNQILARANRAKTDPIRK